MKSKSTETALMKVALGLLSVCLATGSVRAESEADRLVYEGTDAYKTHDYDLAISKFTESIKLDPKNDSAFNNRGLTYRDKKDYDAAIADFNSALGIKADWFVYYNRGTAYYEKRDNDAAIADFTKALKLNPKDTGERVNCLIGRARAYFVKEKAEPAMNDLNAAIKLDQRRPDAYVWRGILHKIDHEYRKSLEDYEKAVGLDPIDPRSYEVEAFLLSVCPMPKYRDGKRAIAYATKACGLTQWKAADSLETLAAAYAEAGQFDDAIKWQAYAAEIDPKAIDEKRLALYQQKQPFRESNRKDETTINVSNIQDRVVIKLGQRVAMHFQKHTDQLVEPKPVQADGQNPVKSPDCLWLDFRQDKRGRVLFLWHSFRRTMRAKCVARLKDYDTYFDTDLLPVRIKTISPEIWKEPVEELVLFDLRLE